MRARLLALLAVLFLGGVLLVPGASAATLAGGTVDRVSTLPSAHLQAASPLPALRSAVQATAAADNASATAGDEAEEEAAESLKGTIRGPDREPIVGLVITVTQDGTEIGSGETNDKGQWEVPLPGPGNYAASVDPEALPEGVTFRTEGGDTVTGVTVRPGANQNVVFQLVAEGDDGAPAAGDSGGGLAGRVAQLLVEGVKFGAIIAITAVGLSLVFGTTRLINFAHGEFVTFGAVAAYYLSSGGGPLPLVIAAVLAMGLTALLAGGIEIAVWRPMRRKSSGLIQMFIVAIGLSLLLRHIIQVIFGPSRRQYDEYALQSSWDLGLFRITPRDAVITLLAFVVLAAVAIMLQRTRIGKAMRAVNDNGDLARASGIDVDRVVLIVWLLGGGLAGLGGVLYGLSERVYPEMGFVLLLMMFAAVILGGLGSAYGAMVGALCIGIITQLSNLWFPSSLQYMWALLVMILVLLFRPQGLLGRRERVG